MASLKVGKVGKQKTKSAAKKRFKKTGSGKWVNDKVAHNHLLLQKSKRQKDQVYSNVYKFILDILVY